MMLKSINAILFSLFLGLVANPSSYLHAQQRDRLITSFRSGMRDTMREPGDAPRPADVIAVEVLGFNLAGIPISLGETFRADDDWLKNLRARVKNISEKPISHVRIIFSLPEARFREDGREYTMSFELEYAAAKARDGEPERKVVLPGDEVALCYIDSPSLPLRQEIANRTGVTSITLLKYGGDVNVIFVDGSVWISGNVPMTTRTKLKN
jgi:hypothetical protein